MNFVRDSSIYVSWPTRRRLKWIAKAEMKRDQPDHAITPDEMAERILNKAIEAEYPGIIALEKQRENLEQEVIEQLARQKPAVS